MWAKIKTVADALDEGCWDQVWWVDADAAFINISRRIDHYLHPQWDGVFAEFSREERTMFSTGIFGCRKGASPLLREVWEERGRDDEEESITMKAEESDQWSRMLLVNHALFNGVYGWNVNFRDPATTFTCHLVGQSNQLRRKVFHAINEAMKI